MPALLATLIVFAAAPVWKKPFRAETGLQLDPDQKRLSFYVGQKVMLAEPAKTAREYFAPPKPDQPGKLDQTGITSWVVQNDRVWWHVSRLNEPESNTDYCYHYAELFRTDLEGQGAERVALAGREEPSEALLVGESGPALLRCACPPRKEEHFALSCRLAALDGKTLAGPVMVAGRYDWELSDRYLALWPSWRGSTFGNAPAPVVWRADGKAWLPDIGGRRAYRGAFGPGEVLAVFAEPYPGYENEIDEYEVLLFNPASGTVQVFARSFQASSARWSPDGKWVAMDGKDFTAQPARKGLYLVSWPDGRSRRFVAGDARLGEAAFSPDSRRLAYPTDDARIFLYDIAVGGAPEELKLPRAEYGAAWFWSPSELLVGREKGSTREFFARMLE